MNKYIQIVTNYKFELAAIIVVLLCTITTIITSQLASGSAGSEEAQEKVSEEQRDDSLTGDQENDAGQSRTTDTADTVSENDTPNQPQIVMVEISGSVAEPDLYKMHTGHRVGNLIEEAGGLTAQADKDFIARNINYAKPLVDGEKIHVPSLNETSSGIFLEKQRYLTYLTSDDEIIVPKTSTRESGSSTISVNKASKDDLTQLAGVGEKTAEKIIENRPYTTLDELITRDVLSENGLKKIQDEISL